jgi:putative tricarboxylic transport membrane protein
MMLLFGVFGYLAKKFDFEAAPFILAVVLEPMLEKALRQSLIIAKGDFSIFVMRPISGIILGIALLLIVIPLFKGSKRDKIASLKEGD